MKVLLVGLAFAAAVVGGGIGYASLKTGTSPTEYLSGGGLRQVFDAASEPSATSNVTLEDRQSDRPAAARDTQQREPVVAEPGDIVISEAELNQMVTDAIANGAGTSPILDLAKAVNTTLEDDRIESGMTLNLGEIPLEELPAEAQEGVEQLIATFPFLANRDVYLGIEGNPTVVEGDIRLENANIKLGPLKLSADSIAEELGISQTDIERQLNVMLDQQGLTPESIQVTDGQLVISGLP